MCKYIVIDTNILISGLISTTNSIPNKAIQKARYDGYFICVSDETLQEFLEVARRKKFMRYFPSIEERENLINELVGQFRSFKVTEKITDCQDPKDNKLLEIALSVNAKLLITGDKKDLISMNPFRGLEIITAREFLETH